MPSDPSGTHPQGVLTRHPADFFDDNIGSGGIYFRPSPGPLPNYFITCALYNNDQRGRVMKVYGISVACDGGGGFGFFFASGTYGAFDHACVPLSPSLPGVPGLVYQQNATGANDRLNDFYTGPFVNIIGSSGFDSHTVVSPFPLFIVPANWSLVGTNIFSSDTTACFYWYQMANE